MSTTSSTSTAFSTNNAISGIASGFDWKSMVSQLIAVERTPENILRTQQNTIQLKNNTYASISTQLNVLNNSISTLKDPATFDARVAASSDTTVASATAAAAAPLGSYNFHFTQLATTAALQGTTDTGNALSATNDVSGVVLGSAGFSTAVTAGTFTVNGQTITIATTDTLKSVFDQVSTATGGAVTASYDAGTDKISFASASPITLGSATDSSNFLQAAQLYNTGGGTVTSAVALGGIHLNKTMSAANLKTPVTDGAGAFSINGVQITYNTATDAITDVLNRINSSAAGVTATYDNLNDRFQLTDKATGDVGISLQDTTGNFLAATGLAGGTLQRGKNLLYTVNGGSTLTSQSNTITSASSGLTGLTVSALKEGASSTVTVSSDTATLTSAVNDFISNYNAAQNFIGLQTASTTDSTGKVTAGTLTGDSDANNMQTTLRHLVASTAAGLSGVFKNLDALGITSNGNDNTLTLSDATKLNTALTTNLSGVKDLFTNATSGLATGMSAYLNSLIGDSGTLTTKQNNFTKQSTDIDTNIANMERTITADQTRLTDEFVAMESAQATIASQSAYLTKNFP